MILYGNEFFGSALICVSLFMWLFGHFKMKVNYYRALGRTALSSEKGFLFALWGHAFYLNNSKLHKTWLPPSRESPST